MRLPHRPRRLRKTASVRELVAETQLSVEQLIWPIFILEGQNRKEEIKTMPGVFRYSLDLLEKEIQLAMNLGIASFALFPALPDKRKNATASEALNENGLIPNALKFLKDRYSEKITLMTDVALDPYSSDGHDGLVKNGQILNDETVEVLAQMALVQAKSGSDFVCPSDMMDGRVGAIRKTLDQGGFSGVGILAYSAKYASAFYGPFRDALQSAPKFGDKKTYQMDFRNSNEALLEVALDLKEGADIVMVKPALSYLDIIAKIKKKYQVPVAAYNVSGEYAMIKAAAQMGMLDEERAMIESLYSIKRAGADMILTYFALDMARVLNR